MLLIWFVSFFLSLSFVLCNKQAVAGSFGSDVAPIKVEPQVAVVCDVRNPLHPQYMDSTGKWVSDMDNKNSCLKDKIEILDFCRKVKNTVIKTQAITSNYRLSVCGRLGWVVPDLMSMPAIDWANRKRRRPMRNGRRRRRELSSMARERRASRKDWFVQLSVLSEEIDFCPKDPAIQQPPSFYPVFNLVARSSFSGSRPSKALRTFCKVECQLGVSPVCACQHAPLSLAQQLGCLKLLLCRLTIGFRLRCTVPDTTPERELLEFSALCLWLFPRPQQPTTLLDILIQNPHSFVLITFNEEAKVSTLAASQLRQRERACLSGQLCWAHRRKNFPPIWIVSKPSFLFLITFSLLLLLLFWKEFVVILWGSASSWVVSSSPLLRSFRLEWSDPSVLSERSMMGSTSTSDYFLTFIHQRLKETLTIRSLGTCH